MQYKVTSDIVHLEQKVRSTTKLHSKDYPRTVEWLKEDEEEDFFSLEEATLLKNYLDTKNNFANNEIMQVDDEDANPSVIGLMVFAKETADGKTSLDKPILISQCKDLQDYPLEFSIEGHLNINRLY